MRFDRELPALTRDYRRFEPIADESGALIGLISATDIFMAVEETGWQEKEE